MFKGNQMEQKIYDITESINVDILQQTLKDHYVPFIKYMRFLTEAGLKETKEFTDTLREFIASDNPHKRLSLALNNIGDISTSRMAGFINLACCIALKIPYEENHYWTIFPVILNGENVYFSISSLRPLGVF